MKLSDLYEVSYRPLPFPGDAQARKFRGPRKGMKVRNKFNPKLPTSPSIKQISNGQGERKFVTDRNPTNSIRSVYQI